MSTPQSKLNLAPASGFKDINPNASGLKFSETKGACHLAYSANLKEVYRFPDGKEWEIPELHSTAATGFRAILLKPLDKLDFRLILAFAGTDATSITDLLTDLSQALGVTPPQYFEASSLAIATSKRHGGNIVLTGHSLGGGLAAYASMVSHLPATTINPAPLMGATITSGYLHNPRSRQPVTNYVAGGAEFVSSSPGINPGVDVKVRGGDKRFFISFFTNHTLGNTAPDTPFPIKVR
jgi:hypothetical protein